MHQLSRLIVSDIHADPNSLRAVVEMAHKAGPISQKICLGDAIGYGDDPQTVLAMLADFDIRIKGNHELLALGEVDGRLYSLHASSSIQRHAVQIGAEGMRFLSTFQTNHADGRMIFYHGAPEDILTYLLNESDIESILDHYPEYDLFFGGHIHIARVAVQNRATGAIDFEDITTPVSRHDLDLTRNRYLINCPSVTPGRFGFSLPGCCRLTHLSSSEATLEFLFVTE